MEKITVITGLSGAGKGIALKAFEDIGYYCIDNLPAFLCRDLLDGLRQNRTDQRARLALVMDVRDPKFPASFQALFAAFKKESASFEVLFLETDSDVLARRYNQHRRRPPLAGTGTVMEGIEKERAGLAAVKQAADRVVDTTTLSPHDLRRLIMEKYSADSGPEPMRIQLISFGFKNGPLSEADMLLDVRFLPNPYFVPELKDHSGLDQRVADYVRDNDEARQFMAKLTALLEFLIPRYKREGKADFTIGIGCTGGRHRSVAMAEAIKAVLSGKDMSISVHHRDIDRG